MIQPLVSIIVPIYKVEPYLRRCLDSIVNQTYANLEIILVDDGSPDSCPQICDEYAANDNRIVVIHKENGGLSDARNTGLNICKGDYISFVDSDDWIADSFVETLMQAIDTHNADIGIANFVRTTSFFSQKTKLKPNQNITELDSLQSVKKLWSEDNVTFIIAWGKLYKATLFTDIRFPKGKIHEDEYTTYKLLYRASKTVFLNTPLYFYFQRNDSIMASVSHDSLRILDAMVERYLFFKKNNEKEIVGLCLQTLCWDLLFAYSQSTQGKKILFFSTKKLLSLYRESVNDYLRIGHSVSHTKSLKLFAKFPWLYRLYQTLSPIKIRKK